MLTATEDLEGISLLQVDGCATPYFRILTIAATKHIQSLTEHVHTLLVEDDTGMARGDMIGIVAIEFGFTVFVFLNGVEDIPTVEDGAVEVDDDITVDMSRVVAATIDVTTLQAAVPVGFRCDAACRQCRWGVGLHIFVRRRIIIIGVPFQLSVAVGIKDIVVAGILHPAHRLDFQTFKVEVKLILDGTGTLLTFGIQDTTLIFGIEPGVGFYIGVVTATDEFFVDDNMVVEIDIRVALSGSRVVQRGDDTSDITAAEEGTEIGGILMIDIVGIETDAGYQLHGTSPHVLGKDI